MTPFARFAALVAGLLFLRSALTRSLDPISGTLRTRSKESSLGVAVFRGRPGRHTRAGQSFGGLAPHHSDPPRHQPRGPLRLPPRLATTQDPRDLAVGLTLQGRDVRVLDTV